VSSEWIVKILFNRVGFTVFLPSIDNASVHEFAGFSFDSLGNQAIECQQSPEIAPKNEFSAAESCLL
jgi:hypothetical protein